MNDALENVHRALACVRISPTIAADYQTRNVFPDLRPPNGEAPGRYFIDHSVSRAIAQAVFDDAIEQAARCGSMERRTLTLAYRALAKRASWNFCNSDINNDINDVWNPHAPGAARPDPLDFREQAPIVATLLNTISHRSRGA